MGGLKFGVFRKGSLREETGRDLGGIHPTLYEENAREIIVIEVHCAGYIHSIYCSRGSFTYVITTIL